MHPRCDDLLAADELHGPRLLVLVKDSREDEEGLRDAVSVSHRVVRRRVGAGCDDQLSRLEALHQFFLWRGATSA